jgi:hypothetical protein
MVVASRRRLVLPTSVVEGPGDVDGGKGDGVREVGTMSSERAEVVGSVPVGEEDEYGWRVEKYRDWKLGGARA